MSSLVSSFITWFQNHGKTISSIGVIPLMLPIMLIWLGNFVHHGWLRLPDGLAAWLLQLRNGQPMYFLYFISTLGMSLVVFGQLASQYKK